MSGIRKKTGSLMLFYLVLLVEMLFLQSRQAYGCLCPNDTLTYNCTVVGTNTGNTVWTGTAFECPRSSNRTFLLHSRYAGGTTKLCNNGDIVARSIQVDSNSYTSELTVRVTSELLGKTITCTYHNVPNISETYFSTKIPGPFSPPSNIHISKADFFSRALTFKWSPATSDCSSNNYTILSSNCGSCPTTTTNTTVTCTDVYSDGGVCTFAVQTTNMIFCRTPWPSSRSELITLMLSDIKKETTTSTAILATLLVLWMVGSTAVIVAILVKLIKLKLTKDSRQANQEQSSSTQSHYEEVSKADNVINTSQNVAYSTTVTLVK